MPVTDVTISPVSGSLVQPHAGEATATTGNTYRVLTINSSNKIGLAALIIDPRSSIITNARLEIIVAPTAAQIAFGAKRSFSLAVTPYFDGSAQATLTFAAVQLTARSKVFFDISGESLNGGVLSAQLTEVIITTDMVTTEKFKVSASVRSISRIQTRNF
jgi:hypothetical protein